MITLGGFDQDVENIFELTQKIFTINGVFKFFSYAFQSVFTSCSFRLFIYLFLREREREGTSEQGVERERGKEREKRGSHKVGVFFFFFPKAGLMLT